MERQLLTAIYVTQGVIRVVLPNGQIHDYAQRGIHKYSEDMLKGFIQKGIIAPYALTLRELPSKYSIQFEDPEVQGRAYVTFNPKRHTGANIGKFR